METKLLTHIIKQHAEVYFEDGDLFYKFNSKGLNQLEKDLIAFIEENRPAYWQKYYKRLKDDPERWEAHKAYNREYHQKRKNDPEYLKKRQEYDRKRNLKKKGGNHVQLRSW